MDTDTVNQVMPHFIVIYNEVMTILAIYHITLPIALIGVAILLSSTGSVTTASVITRITGTEVKSKWLFIFLKIMEVIALNNKPVSMKEKEESSNVNSDSER